MEPTQKPDPKPAALKDRIADLRLGERAAGAGGKIAERMKALQAAAPSAADLQAKLKAALEAARIDKLNRDTLKAGRDGLAAKVEALLKPRAPDEATVEVRAKEPPPAEATKPQAPQPASPTPGETKSNQLDIAAMKARLDSALQPKTQPATMPTVARDMAAAIAKASDAGAERAAAAPTEPRTSWTNRFARKTKLAVDPTEPTIAPPLPTRRTQAATLTATALERPRRTLFSLGLILTALVTGSVLHILTTFAIPALGTGSAYNRLKNTPVPAWSLFETNAMRVLPVEFLVDPSTPSLVPFLSPDMRYAMCRYDLTNGSVQVSAALLDVGWSLALYTPQGDNFYTVPGLEGRTVDSTFNINSASDRVLIPTPGVRRSDTDAANVTSPQREGLVVIRAPNTGSAYAASTEAALKRAVCQPIGRR